MSNRASDVRSGWVKAVGVLGELLITAAVFIGLFVLWDAYFNPWVVGLRQEQTAAEQSRQLTQQLRAQQPTPASQSPTPTTSAPTHAPSAPAGTVPVLAEPARVADTIGVIYIPRLGGDWRRILRQSVDTERVLNSVTAGVGHYTGTAMPGGVGNFAVAAHDIGYGNSFLNLSKLRLGDRIYIQTSVGWYTYTFRNFQFVQPDAVTVLDAIPAVSRIAGADRLMTLTTCYPAVFPPLERVAAYATFVGFDTAPPAELAPLLAKDG
ncbi:class E sortase [Sinomonas sp. JGH33]|uniref:Class E sortase n=1 Tax=Sinomonas terricola TaxID=3110330 RepID=A0ABU5TBD5_9MICC|nr:class E sortase [Sinomonas sp. JGH33]MEA5457005.1 class E sortase [Sinomonas sp. JGH33]